MTAIFANHVFFVRPIAILVYGESVVLPIGGIIIIDVVAFCLTVFMVDAVTSGSTQIKAAAMGLLRNPFVITPVLGVLAWYFSGYVPTGLFPLQILQVPLLPRCHCLHLVWFCRSAAVAYWVADQHHHRSKITVASTAGICWHFGLRRQRRLAGYCHSGCRRPLWCNAICHCRTIWCGDLKRIAKAILFSTLLSILTLSFLI